MMSSDSLIQPSRLFAYFLTCTLWCVAACALCVAACAFFGATLCAFFGAAACAFLGATATRWLERLAAALCFACSAPASAAAFFFAACSAAAFFAAAARSVFFWAFCWADSWITCCDAIPVCASSSLTCVPVETENPVGSPAAVAEPAPAVASSPVTVSTTAAAATAPAAVILCFFDIWLNFANVGSFFGIVGSCIRDLPLP